MALVQASPLQTEHSCNFVPLQGVHFTATFFCFTHTFPQRTVAASNLVTGREKLLVTVKMGMTLPYSPRQDLLKAAFV